MCCLLFPYKYEYYYRACSYCSIVELYCGASLYVTTARALSLLCFCALLLTRALNNALHLQPLISWCIIPIITHSNKCFTNSNVFHVLYDIHPRYKVYFFHNFVRNLPENSAETSHQYLSTSKGKKRIFCTMINIAKNSRRPYGRARALPYVVQIDNIASRHMLLIVV